MKFGSFEKALTAGLATVIAMVVLMGCGGEDRGSKGQFINIATGGTAGTYYPIGGALAELLNKEIPGMRASAQSTGATIANIGMMEERAVDLAIVQNDIAYYAVNGLEMFAGKKIENIRGIATLYPETCQLVTMESSGIASVADLRGKRVAVGAAGSGVEANVRQILAAYGMEYGDIEAQYLSFAEGANALRDGNVDAACLVAGYPTASVQDLASRHRIRLLPVDADKAETLLARYPFYTKSVIPAGTYEGVVEDVPTVSVMAMLVCGDTVDDKLGGDIAKAIFTNLDSLRAAHSVGAFISKERALEGMSLPVNKGAEDFLKK